MNDVTDLLEFKKKREMRQVEDATLLMTLDHDLEQDIELMKSFIKTLTVMSEDILASYMLQLEYESNQYYFAIVDFINGDYERKLPKVKVADKFECVHEVSIHDECIDCMRYHFVKCLTDSFNHNFGKYKDPEGV